MVLKISESQVEVVDIPKDSDIVANTILLQKGIDLILDECNWQLRAELIKAHSTVNYLYVIVPSEVTPEEIVSRGFKLKEPEPKKVTSLVNIEDLTILNIRKRCEE